MKLLSPLALIVWLCAACASAAVPPYPAATLPLNPADAFVCWQGGVTKSCPVSGAAASGGSSVVTPNILISPSTTAKSIPAPFGYAGAGSSPTVTVPSGFSYQAVTGAGAQDGFNFQVSRVANYTGGTNGQVNSGGLFQTQANAGAKAYEWALTASLTNNSTAGDGSQNLAFNATAVKVGTGITGAGNLNIADTVANPIASTVSLENDVESVGGDTNGERVNTDLWAKSYDGNATTQRRMLRFNNDNHSTVVNAIEFNFQSPNCTNFLKDTGGASGFLIDCLGNGTLTSTAVTVWGGRDAISSNTPGGSTIIGSGGSIATCASHFNTSTDFCFTVTTGTGISAAGQFIAIVFADTRARPPNCAVSMGGGTSATGVYQSGASATGVALSALQLQNSTTYTLTGVCGGN